MQFSFVIIDASEYGPILKEKVEALGNFSCLAICDSKEIGLNKVLELKPHLVFLSASCFTDTFSFVGEVNEYLTDLPEIVIVANTAELAYEAFQRGISGFLLKPIDDNLLRRYLFRYQKNKRPAAPKKISIKSQGDYHFVKAQDIVYLKADNNTTDFFLQNGKVITAYKTLKYFEVLLPELFYRIHHGFVVNSDFVSRINIGKSNCYLANNTIILPFSRTYKCNIDAIIAKLSL